MEVATETTLSDATVIQVKSVDQISESESMSGPTVESSDSLALSALTSSLVLTAAASPLPASQSDSSPGQTNVSTCQPEPPEIGTTSH